MLQAFSPYIPPDSKTEDVFDIFDFVEPDNEIFRKPFYFNGRLYASRVCGVKSFDSACQPMTEAQAQEHADLIHTTPVVAKGIRADDALAGFQKFYAILKSKGKPSLTVANLRDIQLAQPCLACGNKVPGWRVPLLRSCGVCNDNLFFRPIRIDLGGVIVSPAQVHLMIKNFHSSASITLNDPGERVYVQDGDYQAAFVTFKGERPDNNVPIYNFDSPELRNSLINYSL